MVVKRACFNEISRWDRSNAELVVGDGIKVVEGH